MHAETLLVCQRLSFLTGMRVCVPRFRVTAVQFVGWFMDGRTAVDYMRTIRRIERQGMGVPRRTVVLCMGQLGCRSKPDTVQGTYISSSRLLISLYNFETGAQGPPGETQAASSSPLVRVAVFDPPRPHPHADRFTSSLVTIISTNVRHHTIH